MGRTGSAVSAAVSAGVSITRSVTVSRTVTGSGFGFVAVDLDAAALATGFSASAGCEASRAFRSMTGGFTGPDLRSAMQRYLDFRYHDAF
ncbi:MAG: hypothetical protein EOP19_30630 [Hyphomicrobiales bacterium]|nr:MAG: hypothetical protein EOP19_30630 [Hyphomicrobiales bacterium]